MIAMLLSAVTSRLAGPIALAGCALLAMMLVGAKLEAGRVRSDLKAQVAESQRLARALNTCQGNVSWLDAAITRQNAAVEAWRAEGVRRSAEAAKALAAARSATAAANQRAGAIMSAKAGADQCASAEALIMETIH